MKHHALLRRGVVVQSVRDGDVDQAIGIQTGEGRMRDVVGGVVESAPARERPKRAAVGVVRAIREELQHQERMGRAALPDVDLDRVVLPPVVLEHAHEIDREAPEHTFIGECGGDAQRGLLNVVAIGWIRGKRAPEIHLSRRTAEQLVVRRDDALTAERIDAALHRGRPDGSAFDENLDDAAHRCELRPVMVPGLFGGFEAESRRQTIGNPSREVTVPGCLVE